MVVMVIFALIVGGIYFQRPETPRGMQDRYLRDIHSILILPAWTVLYL